jgi:hypothetical protein
MDTEAATKANKYLSPDEEMAFLQIICTLGDCAKAVTKAEAMAMIDDLVNENVDHRQQVDKLNVQKKSFAGCWKSIQT